MSFYVQKRLGKGPFRFIVSRRRELSSIDNDTDLSTGASGEFIRHRDEVFYSADQRKVQKAELPQSRSVASTPFWSSLLDGTSRGYAFLGMMAFGAVLILFGLVVVARKGPQGWIPFLLGAGLAIAPIVMTAQKRRQLREIEERRHRERAEREARDRELLAAYSGALDRLRENPDAEALEQVRREREKLDLSYAIWGDLACATVLQVGFSTLAKVGPDRAAEVADLMDRSSTAAGLIDADAAGVKHALYSTILWHLLADDRLGGPQTEIVRKVQKGFRIAPEDVPIDTSSEEQFERLRGIDHRHVPRCDTALPLGLSEYCIHVAGARMPDNATCNVHVTNKRLIFDGPKRIEVALPNIDDIEVDADASSITVRAANLKHPIAFRVEQPIYVASMLSLATTLDERPKSFT
jgi:hypothetical protein